MSDYVSEDVLLQIFKSLPVNSLLRFRCLSKHWKEVIDSDQFAQSHLAAQNPKLLVAYERPDEFLVLDPRTLPSFSTLRVLTEIYMPCRLVGTLHGIVCLHDNDFLVWNPSIHRYRIVPLPDFIELYSDDDEDEVPHYFAFWMDPRTKHFKIIVFKLVPKFTHEPIFYGVLYSSITQDWVFVPLDKLRNYTPLIEGPPVIIDEVAYWRVEHEWEEQETKLTEMVVVSFDFARGTFEIMEMPEEVHIRTFVKICKLQGALSVVYWNEVNNQIRCSVYLRQEGVWVKTKLGSNILPQCNQLYWVWEETEGKCAVLAPGDGSLVLYDAKDECVELMTGLQNSFGSVFVAGDYVESLLFVAREL